MKTSVRLILAFASGVTIFLVLLGYFYVSLDPVGIAIAGLLFLTITGVTEANVFKLSHGLKLLLFVALVVASYFIIGTWMVSHAPGGSYSPRTGLETRAWWTDGTYTEFGRSLVWRWVGWGVALYTFAECLRHGFSLIFTSEKE